MAMFEPQWDKDLFLTLNFDGGEFWDQFFWIVSGKLTWVPLYILILVLLIRRYGWRYTLLAVVFIGITVALVDQTCNLLKDGIAKLRPTHNPDFEGLIHLVKKPNGNFYSGYMYGSVSAHAATTFAIMTFSSTLVRARWFTVLTILWALLVCYSRIYIGAHYPLDLILGAILGIVAGVLMVRLFRCLVNKIDDRRKSRLPAS